MSDLYALYRFHRAYAANRRRAARLAWTYWRLGDRPLSG